MATGSQKCGIKVDITHNSNIARDIHSAHPMQRKSRNTVTKFNSARRSQRIGDFRIHRPEKPDVFFNVVYVSLIEVKKRFY